MAQGFDFNYSVSVELAAHYSRLREVRGWSWETLAEYFEQERTDPTSAHLAAWARAQVEVQPKAARAKRSTERATKAPREKR